MPKPILFLDFDRTLFDTERLYEWLGGGPESALLEGKAGDPDLASMLYPDVLPFLKKAQHVYRLVLLTSTMNLSVQKKKVHGIGITPYFNDIIMVEGSIGNYSNKGSAIKKYLHKPDIAPVGHVFVDDIQEFISEAKGLNPQVRCIRIVRSRRDREVLSDELLPPDDVVTTLPELLALLHVEPSGEW